MKIFALTIASKPWQLSASVELPEHGVPPLYTRERDLVPWPQLVEHEPHSLQDDHVPSTILNLINSGNIFWTVLYLDSFLYQMITQSKVCHHCAHDCGFLVLDHKLLNRIPRLPSLTIHPQLTLSFRLRIQIKKHNTQTLAIFQICSTPRAWWTITVSSCAGSGTCTTISWAGSPKSPCRPWTFNYERHSIIWIQLHKTLANQCKCWNL